MADTVTKPPRRKAPSPEKSDLPCTHITCNRCDNTDPYLGEPLDDDWFCMFCGSGDLAELIFEHHSPRPLGFIDDKAQHWPALELAGTPEVWIYNAKDPRE